MKTEVETINGRTLCDLTARESIDKKISTPETATVGQTIIVTEVDENGKPVAWETADLRGVRLHFTVPETYVDGDAIACEESPDYETVLAAYRAGCLSAAASSESMAYELSVVSYSLESGQIEMRSVLDALGVIIYAEADGTFSVYNKEATV